MKRLIAPILTFAFVAAALSPLSAGEPTYGFKFGGYVKADAMWDNTRIYPGDYRIWVVAEEEKNNAFYLTANETRLGFDFWWDEGTYKTTAKIEFDFFGGGPATNKSNPMMRHAYIKLAADNWALLFGQTWDIISPLNPKTVNYSVQWGQGNIGYRRPQMRFTFKMKPGEESTVKIDAGISRNIGLDLDENGIDDGADAGLPAFQGRLGFGAPIGSEGKLSIGVSGHYATEKYTDPGTDDIDAADTPSWSINGDLAIKITKRVALLGEFFMGENLNQYLGGILQGVNPLGDPLPSMGGWGLVQVKATDRALLNFGYGFDDPDDGEWKVPDDTETYSLRDFNSEAYGNLMYSLTDNVSLMFELAYMQTKYMDKTYGEEGTTNDYDGMRFQFAVKAAIK
jgi:hypothetical protein